MRIGIVCPYSFDAPGGVQFHIRDVAAELITRGHEVSVLAPAEEGTPLPPFVVPAGRAVPIPYNGSVARLAFGPLASARVATWLAEGNFDILHLHEPITPSLSMLALWQSRIPTVATFHSAQDRSRALQIAAPVLETMIEKLDARIAVSAEARRTVVDHLGGDAWVIPNGVFLDHYRSASLVPQWRGRRHGGSSATVAFLGRLDEPRKGLPIFADASRRVLQTHPDTRFLIAGRGEADDVRAALADLPSVEFLGEIEEDAKASLLASVDVYVAPQTGGESFGIVLVEAQAGGAVVVASDIPAFRAVLDDGRTGCLFPVGDADALAGAIRDVIDGRAALDRSGVRTWADQFDWRVVTDQVLAVYHTVLDTREVELPAAAGARSAANARWRRRLPWRR